MIEPADSPIFPTSAHLTCRDGPVACWFTDPPGVVFQLLEPARMTANMAQWIVGPAFDSMLTHFASSEGELVFLIDLRPMTGRDADVRATFMSFARNSGSKLRAAVIIPPRRANPLYVGGLQTASALVSAFAPSLEITNSVPDVLDRYHLVAADWKADLPSGTRGW